MARVSFLGLGVMGYPMAGHLVTAGHTVRVWNRTPSKVEEGLAHHTGRAANSPAEAASDSDYVIFCLGDDPDVREVFAALEAEITPGMVVVDHTTASADLARDLSRRVAGRGGAFLDAPVSGGEAGARAGALTIMCGGEASTFQKTEPILAAYGRKRTLIGPSGAGQLAKSVNQICIAGIVQGLAEGLHFAETAGLDIARTIEAISGGAAQSWQMDNRWQSMSEGQYDHGFAVDWMRKDLRIALQTAATNGGRLPLTALVDQFYGDVQAAGGARWDTSSLLTRLKTD